MSIFQEVDLLAKESAQAAQNNGLVDPFIFGLAFILACFVGYFVVWKVSGMAYL